MLGDMIADAMDAYGDDPAKVAKARRSTCARRRSRARLGAGDSPLRTAEYRDAVAAGIQNLLLGATVPGFATYWGSCPKGANDAVAGFCGFEPDTHVTALIYLGWATTVVVPPE